MAPIKRPIAALPEDDGDSEPGSSNLDSDSSQTLPRKRRRTTDEPLIREDSRNDDGNDPDMDSEAEAEYEQLATQAIRERNAKDKDNEPAECGILEEVHVENFMNHKNFTFELGPLINFVCGKNGSGKSAILTALTLCLGAKAASTNRGQALKNFVREGQEQAIITVKIKNHGHGAYMPGEYGDSIIVERRFTKTGSSGFKLKSERGRVISTKKADLEEICDHFALQMDNPMNVLSQDMARQFISGSNASEKYRFFVKGVQLEQLDQDYRLIEENLDHIENKLEAKRPDLKVLEEKMENAKRKLALSDRHNGLLDKQRHYRRQLAWVQVEDQEKIRDEYTREIENADDKIAEAERQVATLDERYQAADQGSSQAAGNHQRAEHDVTQAQREKTEVKERFDEVKRGTQDAQAEQRTIHSALKEVQIVIKTKEREIESENERLAALDGGGAAARHRMLTDAQETAKIAHQAFDAHQGDRSLLDRDIEDAENTVKGHQGSLKAKSEEVDRRKHDMDAISRNRGQEDLAFHPQMPALLRAVQNEGSFNERPVGPIGKHVRLLKPEWSSILEKSFGGSLGSFIVTSKRDMNTLHGIMNRANCFCPIIIGNNQSLDTTPHEPDGSFDTTLRVLEIDNDLVRKQLVIQHGIEQTILIADMEEASNVLYNGNKPRNVKRCYSIDRYDKRRGFMQSFTRTGEASQDPIHEYSGRPRMSTDIEAQIRSRQEALDDTKSEFHELETRCQSDRETLKRAKQAVERHKRTNGELKVAYQRADDKVEEIMGAISEDSVENGKLQVLQVALKEAEEGMELHAGSYEDAVIAYDAKKEELNAARTELQAMDDRIADLSATCKKLESEAQRLSRTRATALGEKNGAIARVDDGKQDRASLERKRQVLENDIENWTRQAGDVSPRVNIDAGETQASLMHKYNKLQRDYERYQREIGASREEIAANAVRTDEAYQSGRNQVQGLEDLGRKLKETLQDRRSRWIKFRSFIACRARSQFTYLLSERSFRGRLITDHAQKLLELSVEPDITKKDGSGRGAKTLSGGEKSFSQICLLLSIWEAMGSPIRCLDEFDVFMDSVNRKMSIDMLIGAARQSFGRQFVLISPGTQSDFKKAPDVSITELAAPERGQQTLAF